MNLKILYICLTFNQFFLPQKKQKKQDLISRFSLYLLRYQYHIDSIEILKITV